MLLAAVIMLLAVSATPSLAASTYNSHLRRYPYLTDTVGSYATINWGTDQFLSTGGVRYGAVASEPCTAHYVPAVRNTITVNSVPEYQWSAMLNLAPDTKYCYRVYQGSSPATEIDLLGADASPSFVTQVPAGSTEPYSFVVFGDWGYVDSTGANPYQASLMSLIAKSGARFAVTAGDNGYPTGTQTNYGDLVQTGSGISGVFGPSFWKLPGSSTPIFPASGNHGLSVSDTLQPLLLNFPETRAVALSGGRYVKETYCCIDGTTSAAYPSAWYAFDAGLARIYVLDAAWSEANIGTASSPYQVDHDYHWTTTSPEYLWLQSDLAAHPSALKFAVWHYPLYTDDNNIPSDTYLHGSSGLEGLLKQYGVNLAFTGHSHTYERNLADATGLPSYVNGGGGAVLTTLGTCTSLDAYGISFNPKGKACGSASLPTSADQVYHFNSISVNGTHVTVSPMNSLGQTFDVQNYDFSAGSESIPPSTPANVWASAAGGTEIDLTWSASSDNTGVRGYGIYRGGALIGTTDATTLNYSDSGLAPDTTYSYTVDAFDAYGNHSPASSTVTATTAGTASYTFSPVADAYVRSDAATSNYGLGSTLTIDASPDYHTYLRFNVTGTAGAVTKATLRLFANDSSSAGCLVRGVAATAWDENQVTYANGPALGSLAGTSAPFAAGNWVDVDVTSLITGNGLYDMAVASTSSTSVSFNSRDAASNWPQLIIETDARPPTPTPTATPTATATPTSTPTRSLTAKATATQTPTSTATASATFTATTTATATNTPTVSPNAAADPTISGNAGVANGALTYTDGVIKTAVTDTNGNYSFTVSYGWSGTVSISKAGYAFTPDTRNYTNLLSGMTGQDYTAHALITSRYRSIAAQDGWVLEGGETTNAGGTTDASDPTFRLGDNASREQYRGILSFATAGLPDKAVITRVALRLTRQSVVPSGSNPFRIFQGMLLDVRTGYFGGSSGLEARDFRAPANKGGALPQKVVASGGLYRIIFPSGAFSSVNLSSSNAGLTQLRLRFKLGDNNDGIDDYISFFSGDALISGYRPTLVITYYVP